MKQFLPDFRTEAVKRISKEAERFEEIETAQLDGFLKRCSDAKIVLLGESTHGTSEFYRMRMRISEELIRHHGFEFIAIEAGWADAEAMDLAVRPKPSGGPLNKSVLNRFGSWMWKNREFASFMDWLKGYNQSLPENSRIGLYGLDVYGVDVSLEVILDYLDRYSPHRAREIRELYSELIPWKENLVQYGHRVKQGVLKAQSEAAAAALRVALQEWIGPEESYFHLIRNIRSVSAAEEYYRVVYNQTNYSWNMRDLYFFETLEALLAFKGPQTKGIVWAHNSHTGDARAGDMGKNGFWNLGQLCREKYGESAYRVGFGFHRGTLLAAPYYGGPQQVMEAAPPLDSEAYESLFHDTGASSFFLPLRPRPLHAVRQLLLTPRLQRGLGVSYQPSDSKTNFYSANLPEQFDEFIWFDEAEALSPLPEGAPFPTHKGLK